MVRHIISDLGGVILETDHTKFDRVIKEYSNYNLDDKLRNL
ncbi:MAG: hypothetical protein AAB772_00635 [Patescibacteria group bacterium]